jgi:hypothetical protein
MAYYLLYTYYNIIIIFCDILSKIDIIFHYYCSTIILNGVEYYLIVYIETLKIELELDVINTLQCK